MDIYLKAAKYIANIFSYIPSVFIGYFIIINIAAFIMFYADKKKAINHQWRIPEATLLLFSFLGGSIGAYISMKTFHHKTKHPKFYILVPIFIAFHLIIIITIIIGIKNI